MVDSFLPGPRADVVWRRLKAEDAQDLYELIVQIEEVDNFLYRTSVTEVQEMLNPAQLWDCVGAFALDGPRQQHLVCYGYAGVLRSGVHECRCEGGVHPWYRNRKLGQATLQWQTERAKQLALAAFPGEPAQISYVVEASKLDVQEQLELLGYRWRESSVEMRRRLRDMPEEPDLGSYTEIVPWSEDLDNSVRRALNQAGSLGLNARTYTAEEWTAALGNNFAPEWSFVALDKRGDRPQVVGFVQVARYEQDWKALGWREGYIDMAAVLKPSSQQVLEALIVRSMRAQADSGMSRTGIGMDPDRDPVTFALYQRLGFKAHSWSRIFAQSFREEQA